MPEHFECTILAKKRYINTLPFLSLMAVAQTSISHTRCSAISYTAWLPAYQRIQFKIAFLAFNCIRAAGPACFQHVCILTVNLSGGAGLRSVERV